MNSISKTELGLRNHPLYSMNTFEYARSQMLKAGISDDLIQKIEKKFKHEHFEEKSLTKVISLNIFGFLYHGDYSAHNTPEAVRFVKKYVKKHIATLNKAEKKYGVSKYSIASLLWVETKLGKVQGTYPLPLVYYSLVLAGHPKVCSSMYGELPKFTEHLPAMNSDQIDEAKVKIANRCESKSQWALEELKAINTLETSHKTHLFHKKASFAGATGIPQFIPSSVLKYAKSEFRRAPDLTKDSDAIFSVAYFLNTFGWKNDSVEAQKTALFNYNKSHDYGDVILKISDEVKQQ